MGTERALYERDRHDGDEVACIFRPQTATTNTYYSATVFMRGFDRALFCVLGGAAAGAGDTIAISVQEATAAGAEGLVAATGSRAIASGAKVTTLPATAGTNYAGLNNKWLLEVRTEEMDVDLHYNYLQLKIVVASAGWLLAAEAVRSVASYEPVATTNITQIVA